MDEDMTPHNQRHDGTTVFLLFLYLILKPIYIFPPGLPQIADAVMVLFLGHQFIRLAGRVTLPRRLRNFVVWVIGFAYWTAVVNVTAAILVRNYGSLSFLMPTLMNVYNAAVVVAVLAALRSMNDQPLKRAIYYGALLSILLQPVVFAVQAGSGSVRVLGTFNNPNQLGFHAILVICLLTVCHAAARAPALLTMLGIGAALFCVALSLSRSAVVAAIVVLAAALVWPREDGDERRKFRAIMLVLSSALTGILLWTDLITGTDWYERAVMRSEKSEPNGFESARGYDRIFERHEFWITGAGEGAHWRFGTHEVHSTLGNVQFSYGVIGTLIFAALTLAALRRAPLQHWILIAGVLIYGLAHNGIRNTVAWILLSLIVFEVYKKRDCARETARCRPERSSSREFGREHSNRHSH